MATEAIRRAVKKYDAANTVQFHLKLNVKTDAAIIEKLKSVEKVQTYLKELIAADVNKWNEQDSTIKPCPFFGREVKLEDFVVDEPFTFTDAGFEIRCKHCGIKFREHTSCLPGCDKKADEAAKKKLAARWNKRH